MKKIYKIIFIVVFSIALINQPRVLALVDNKNLGIIVNNTELVLEEQKYKYYVKVPYDATNVYLTIKGYSPSYNKVIELTDEKTVYNFTVTDEEDNDVKEYTLTVIKAEKTKADEQKEQKEKIQNFITSVKLYVVYFLFLIVIYSISSGVTVLIKKIIAALKK